MNSAELARYAAKYAAGSVTSGELLRITGDESVVSQIIALAGGNVVGDTAGEVAARSTKAARQVEIIDDLFGVADDALDLFGF